MNGLLPRWPVPHGMEPETLEPARSQWLSCLLMKQTKITDKNPIEFNSRILNLHISNINQKLWDIDWIGHLNNKSCDTNFNTFCDFKQWIL